MANGDDEERTGQERAGRDQRSTGEPGYGQAPGDHPRYGQPPYPQPPYGQAGYGQPPYGQPGYQVQSTNGMAIASMVLGILWLYWIGSVLALVFGYIARKQIDASGGAQGGRGMAIAGIVLGWIGVGFLVLAVVIGIAAALATRSGTEGF